VLRHYSHVYIDLNSRRIRVEIVQENFNLKHVIVPAGATSPSDTPSWAAPSATQTFFFSSKAKARLQTFSTVNPYSRIRTGPGAEAPK
jgi:hypothetical protein